MDFYKIQTRSLKKGYTEVFPNFLVKKSNDLMIRGNSFYAIWDETTGLWSTDEYSVARLIDEDLYKYAEELEKKTSDIIVLKTMRDFDSGSWTRFKRFVSNAPDSYHSLDERVIFKNTTVVREDYASKRLPYSFAPGDTKAYEELISTLYSSEEREKIEWAIGAVFSGDSKTIQKFIVLYGNAGSGKSTVLNIIQKLFHGYYDTFEAKALGQSSNQFATEMFKSNPLVAIQHDGDLSKIEDNSKLNSIISHEEMLMNEKFKSSYTSKINSFLFMATNKPVKITDSKSGIIRRLIDVHPSGNIIPTKKYMNLMSQVEFELGGIASHCLNVYHALGKNHYMGYKPISMMYQTDPLFNFVEENYYIFKNENGISLRRAWEMYNSYMDDSGFSLKLNKMRFKEELKAYFLTFEERKRVKDENIRNYYSDFDTSKFESDSKKYIDDEVSAINLEYTSSKLDDILSECYAQYASDKDTPIYPWDDVTTKLKDLDTSKTHFILVPENHIVIDFDLKDSKGNKSKDLNLEAASKFPKTYAEYSKSGSGIHLHYIYDGDVNELQRSFDNDIEVKIFSGKSSLRRKLSLCNNESIATINSGLPLKKEVAMIDFKGLSNEKAIRTLVERNLKKEIHPGTKPSIDFINKILLDAYESGIKYDISDLRPSILNFAARSTNHSSYCVNIVSAMKFKSENASDAIECDKKPIVFFDVEVFPNLFIICWKVRGDDKSLVRMINPTPEDCEQLLNYRLIGFNNRRYDNHILYGRILGFNNNQLFGLSQRIINNSKNGTFSQAYGISYADIYDFSSKKQSLKKFELDLNLIHKELDMDWNEPVPEDKWDLVAEYCENDVISTEVVFEDRYQDYIARKILADISGLTVNDTTQKHTAKIIFGSTRDTQKYLKYTDLSLDFKGYEYNDGVSTYKGETVGEGGYVYAEPGIYENVALLDVVSMHPTSAIKLDLFGKYTSNFKQLLDARVAIKNHDFDKAKNMMNGLLTPYLEDVTNADDLAYALKIVINIVYGLTSAKFENPFRDVRNIDNIVAKRGALFMIDLKEAVQKKGFTVAHIKTDSIKIPNATDEIINFIKEFGERYGYTFEHEATYKKMCLINNAVYVAQNSNNEWTATGAQFKHPYVFKTLFTGEETTIDDIAESKTAKTAFYLDMNENIPENEHNYVFVGKVGKFIPVMDGEGGGLLMRKQDEDYHFAAGSKGYRWMLYEIVKNKSSIRIDYSYADSLVNDAINAISNFGDYKAFIGVK